MSDKAISDLAAATVETPPPHPGTPAEQAAQILAEAASPPPAEPETASPEAQASESWDVKDLAERLKVDPAKVYEGLKVAFDDGTVATLSELKDRYRPAAELEKAREQLLEEVTSSRKEVAEAQQELSVLLQRIASKITPEDLQESQRGAESLRLRQSEALLKALPEWKDPIRRAADWADIRKVAKAVGYTDVDLKMAEMGMADPRVLQLALKASRAQEPPKPQPKVAVAPKAAKPQTEAQQFGQLKAAVKTGRLRPEQAAAQLLKGI